MTRFCTPLILLLWMVAGEVIAGTRLPATGGASTIEGTAGGGIVPMAVLAGTATREEQSGAVFASYVDTGDFQLRVLGGAWNLANRLEVSLAEQTLTHKPLSRALGVAEDEIRQSIIGVKVRLAGDLIYTAMPQISIGVQHKHNRDFFIPSAVGARDDSGTDIYLSASKLLLAGLAERNWLINGTVRRTRANQLGLVGFGGDKSDSASWVAEVSSGVFLTPNWLLGAEYRQKPDQLSAIKEDDWYTGFVAWFPNRRVSLVAAYVDLGEVANFKDQTGWYLSLQGSF